MNKFSEYVNQAMAATGFCVIDSVIASRLRQDLWPDARQCSGDFALARKRGFSKPSDAPEYLLRLRNVDHDLQLLARHSHGLLERVQWITGMVVVSLHPMADLQGTVQPLDIQPKPAPAPRGDVHAGLATKEGPRACSDCNWLSQTGRCLASEDSGIDQPLQKEPRRCKGFRPHFEALDARTGAQLWPELFIKESNHGA